MKSWLKILVLNFIVIVVLSSCSTTFHGNGFYRTYESVDNEASDPTYLTLKAPIKEYEFFSPTMNLTTIGLWEVKGDTLVLNPKLDYTFSKGVLCTDVLTDSTKSVTSIQKIYLVKDNELIDITNYGQVCPEIMGNEHSMLIKYKLIK